MNRFSNRLFAVSTLTFVLGMLTQFAPTAMSQANVTGTWQKLTPTMPINPVHVSLLKNGKVLVVSGSGNVANNPNLKAAIWDPATGTVSTPQTIAWDMFCNGSVNLPDGRPFIVGGTLQYDPFHGETRSAVYDVVTNTFTDQQPMAHGRWYPTATVLGDGRVLAFSGLSDAGGTNTTTEIFTVGSGWGPEIAAPWTPPLYPRMHLLPNGTVFYSGSTTGSSIFNPTTNTWSVNVASTIYGKTRTYGSSVLLPLTPANGYKPRVMIFGGGNPSTATTEIIDLSAASPKWVSGPSMSLPRIEMDATLLPSGQILTSGGSLNDEDNATASLGADLFDANGATVSSAGTTNFARLYHSVTLLLPDATVFVAGGNPARGTYENRMEIYTPPYLYNANGTLATRPSITNVSSATMGYGSAFSVITPDAANISSVVLMRNGSSTHAFDMDQRYVGLNFTKGSGVLNVTGPPTGNIAPPGYYMLFILNATGVPSVASIIQVTPSPGSQPPSGIINTPTANVSIIAGQSVSYSGTGTDPGGSISAYSWSFPGGSPNSSNLANPGAVIYSTPGTYTTTLTVTDNSGLTDPNPPTRTITVLPPGSTTAVNFGSGFSGTGMQLNGHATLNGTRLQLTDSVSTSESASAFWSIPVNIQTFTNDFTFQLTNPNADGFTFAIQNAGSTAMGQPGANLGYAGTSKITPSVAVKFDLYSNAGEGTNSTGLYTNGAGPTLPATTLGGGVNLHSGDVFQVHMTYDGTTLTMTITDTAVPANTFTTSWPINVPTTVAASTAFVGFTAGTGGATATQEIITWTYSSGSTSSPAATPVITPATGTYTTPQTVSITDGTPGATIFYTLNNTQPTTSSTQYTGAFQVTATTTVKAIATATNFTQSATATSAINIQTGGGGGAINFGSGFSAVGMQFNGHTQLNGTRLQLTDGTATSEVASAFWTTPVNVQNFTNDFTFQLTNPNADGFTFTIQGVGPTAIGQNGGSLGYGGTTTKILKSVAVKFDLYSNAGEGVNSTGLYTNGTGPTVPATTFTGGVNLHSGDIFQVHMTYDGATLTMTITDAAVPADTFTTSWPVNIPTMVGANTGYAGFTAGTGGATATQEIINWTYNVGGTATPAATPTFSLPAGTYTGTQSVSLADVTTASTIFYTLDGSVPNTTAGGSTVQYGGAISIASTKTVNAIATAPGFSTSAMARATYTINAAPTPDFSVAVAPGARSIAAGAGTSYTATITPTNGFTGTVTFSVAGLPNGATGSFSPTSVAGTGTSTMTVSTTASVLAGTYPLTITATSGTLSHTGPTSLVITGGTTPTVNFASGFTATGMQFNGHTQLNGTRLQLTDGTVTNEVASAFWATNVNVAGFTNDFTFQLTNPNADGFTFTIQGVGPTAIGQSGGNLGYAGATTKITKSVTVKFDLFSNKTEGPNSTGLYTNAAGPTIPAITLAGGVDLHSGHVFQVHMTYDGTTLTMTINDVTVPANTFTTSWTVNIPTTVGATTAYVGFTAGTGGNTATQEILNWTYNPTT